MPSFFEKLNIGPYKSSSAHRNTQRANGFTNGISTGIQASTANFSASLATAVNPLTIIPTKTFQSGLSFYTMLRKDVQPSERVMNFAQGIIESAQLFVAIFSWFKGETCSDVKTIICKLAFVLQLIYLGLLIFGWGPSELAKGPAETTAVNVPAPDIVNNV